VFTEHFYNPYTYKTFSVLRDVILSIRNLPYYINIIKTAIATNRYLYWMHFLNCSNVMFFFIIIIIILLIDLLIFHYDSENEILN